MKRSYYPIVVAAVTFVVLVVAAGVRSVPAASHQLGAGMAALGAGWTRTLTGTYDQAFIASGILCLLTSTIVLAIARHPRVEPAFA